MEGKNLVITGEAKGYLSSAASWTKFMAILSFIGLGLGILVMLPTTIAGSAASAMYAAMYPGIGGIIGVFYFAMLVLYAVMLIPTYFLYKFAADTKKALLADDVDTITSAFNFLKKYWKFYGIFTIVVIGLCIIAIPVIIATAIGAASAMMS